MKKITFITVAIMGYLITSGVYAAPNSPWADALSSESASPLQYRGSGSKIDKPKLHARALRLDINQFKAQLNKINTVEEGSLARGLISDDEDGNKESDKIDKETDQVFIIPLPNGEQVEVIAQENSVLAPELAKQFPEMKSWTVRGKLDTAIHGRVDFDEYGFHAMLTMPDGDTVFIEPDSSGEDDENNTSTNNKNIYLSFSKASNTQSFDTDFQCSAHTNDNPIEQTSSPTRKTAARVASSLITYRLAVAATGEYTRFHGGSKASALSAIRTTINRVNEIYERDLGITFQLVAEELDIIYTNPLFDPYTNNNADALLEENINNLTRFRALSRDKFDVGHVFSTGAGGIATLGSACNDLGKAGGATGVANPIGDAFYIDYVTHELGHQLGANHTFNSNTGFCAGGTRNQATAVEPGSGSTVMAYAGICGDNNLQANSDAVFHAVSMAEIIKFTRTANQLGSFCGTRTAVTNHDPIPNAGPDNVIPANTPFILSGSGTDPNTGDSLSYTWDQNNAGTVSNVNVDTGDNAIIRSFLPQNSATRYIPRLVDLFQNKRLKSEKLPETDRVLNFTLTARDGKGGFEFDNLLLNVVDTGNSFQVTSHRNPENLEVGQSTQVSWFVAGTNSAPISCTAVEIGLIQSNGSRINVVQQTANDGTETVIIPSNAQGMNGARFIVNCSDSDTGFFNISDADLRIVAPGSGSGGGSGSSSSSSGGSSTGGSSSGSSSGGGLFDYTLMLLLLSFMLLKNDYFRKAALIKITQIKQGVTS